MPFHLFNPAGIPILTKNLNGLLLKALKDKSGCFSIHFFMSFLFLPVLIFHQFKRMKVLLYLLPEI